MLNAGFTSTMYTLDMPGGLEKQEQPMSSALRVGIASQLEIVLDDWKNEKKNDLSRDSIWRNVHNVLGVAKVDENSSETSGAYKKAVHLMLQNDIIKRDKLNEIVELCREVYE